MSARTILNPPTNSALSGINSTALSITQFGNLLQSIGISPSDSSTVFYTFPIAYSVAPTTILVNIITESGNVIYNTLSITTEKFELAYTNPSSTETVVVASILYCAFGGTLSE